MSEDVKTERKRYLIFILLHLVTIAVLILLDVMYFLDSDEGLVFELAIAFMMIMTVSLANFYTFTYESWIRFLGLILGVPLVLLTLILLF